jgi:DNA repair exonuclease SbcCD ATPase subunit
VIRRIRIRDWRPYRDATIELDRPIVFFVAPNGVGKTSVYEAARCCLFGFPKARTARRAVRAGADRAELSMALTVGAGVTLTVTRTLTRTGRTTFAAARDGESLDEGAFLALLQRSWAADPALLDRLMFGDSDPLGRAKAPLPVRDHLAELLGVTPMLEAAAVLRTAQAVADETVAGLRIEAAGSEAAISQAEAAVASAQEAQSEILTERQSVRQRVGIAEQAAAAAAAWEAYRTAAAAYNDQVETLLSEVGELITVDPADPAAALEGARRAAERDLAAARRAAAEADRAAARAATAADLLADAGGVCPTCLRPLNDEELAAALHAHNETTAAAGAETEHAAAETSRTEQHLWAIGEFTRRLDRLQRPVPPGVEDPGATARTELAELRALDGAVAERIGEARARLDAATFSLQTAHDSAEDSARLNQAAREELLLDTMAGILEAVADRYLNERIEPLKRDIEHLWKLIFGTEGLVLDPTGDIRLRRGDVELGFDDMSGGERAIAGVIVRLLVAAAATHIPALWFDEPLEHLDLRRRAGVAQTLVQAVAVGTVDQLVVTTYEEGIAHRLALAAPGLVAVVHADDRPARPETTAP